MLHQSFAEKAPFEVVIIDMQMPGTDGLALIRRINANPVLRATRCILLTPFGKPMPIDELKIANIATSCAKPVRQAALFDCLVQVLTRSTKGSAPLGPSTIPVSLRKERILLAEDNVINQRVALGNLRKLGYRADVAANGIEVLSALERKRYDIILMDCQMPGMDGYEVTKELRRREQAGTGRGLSR